MRIQVLGWFGKGNVGDEAYKLAYPLVLPDHDMSFVTEFESPPDLAILGGGDVVHAHYTGRFRELPPGSPYAVASVSLTEGSDFDFLRGAVGVNVRDRYSLRLAIDRGIDAVLIPDFAFALRPDADRGRSLALGVLEGQDKDVYDRIVVVVVSAYLMHAGPRSLSRDLTRFLQVSQDLSDVLDSTDASVLFVPFCTRDPIDDRAANSFVASRCKWHKKHAVIHGPVGVQDALDLIAGADAVVSTRLHSSIFATVAATPFVDVTHHSKNAGYLETIGRPELSVPFWDFGRGVFREKLGRCLDLVGSDPGLSSIAQNYRSQLDALRLFR